MTIKEKEQFLINYRLCGKRIDRLCDELSQWRIRAAAIYHPPLQDLFQNPMTQKLEQEIREEIQKMCQIRCQVKTVIAQVPDETLRLLLEYRYINGDTFMTLAEKMHYSYMHITRLHTKALSELLIDPAHMKHLSPS